MASSDQMMAKPPTPTNGTAPPPTRCSVPILEKFFLNLKSVLIASNTNISALDDYELDSEFISYIMTDYFKEKGCTVKTISNIQVYEGPQTSSISSNLSVRFDFTTVQHGITEEGHMDLFFKVPPYGGYSFNLLNTNNLHAKENSVYSDLFKDFAVFLGTPLKPYVHVIPELVFAAKDFETTENNLLVVMNLVDAGYYCPRDRFLDKLELKSVLKVLAKFHADGIAFKRKNPKLYHNQDHTYIVQYPFLRNDMHRPDYMQSLIDKYFDPYVTYLEKHYPYVRPALLLLKEMKSTIVDRLFGAEAEVPPAFKTICHSNLWNGNLFLKKTDLICHDVKLVDWTHCQIASFTSDIVHTVFNCCSTDIMNDWADLLNEYYDFFKMYLKEHNLDRSNLKIDFDTFWSEVAKSVKSEFVHLSVLTPLAILCGQHMAEEQDRNLVNEVNALFENDLVEEDVLPILEMAMALGLTKCIEKLAPDLYKEETRRGSILSGKLVTRKESMKEPVPACIRRKRQSLVPPKKERSGSLKRNHLLRRNSEPGDSNNVVELCSALNAAACAASGLLSREKRRSSVPVVSVNLQADRDNVSEGASGRTTPGSYSRKDSLSEDAMEALKRFQLTNSKMMGSSSPGRQSPANQQELGNALKMIKKRRSLFEHASVFGYGTW